LLEARQRGLDVPRQLAIMGFGDFEIGRQLRPLLSTIRPPRSRCRGNCCRARAPDEA